jgi:hypothetical protein
LSGCPVRDFDPADNADLLNNTLMLITDLKLCNAQIELYHEWRLSQQQGAQHGR